jgi:CBS domain-containing protein
MSDGGFRHVPVLDGDRIWGVVSRSDFSGAEIEQLEEEVHLSEVIW